MKAGYFTLIPYPSDQISGWPNSPSIYEPTVGTAVRDHIYEQALAAEAAGFEWISSSEHHYWGMCPTPNPQMLLAALGEVCKTVKLAYLGPLVSINNPIRIAEDIATLDQLSDGRAMVVYLRGTPNEFMAFDTDPAIARARTQEGTALILKALTEPEPFGWEGEHFRFRTVAVWPKPTQSPYPPSFYSGNSPESTMFAARHGLRLAQSYFPFEACAKFTTMYKDECERLGRKTESGDFMYRAFMCLGQTEDEVQDRKRRFFGSSNGFAGGSGGAHGARGALMRNHMTLPPGGSLEAFALGMLRFSGTPSQLVEQLGEFHETTGIGLLDLSFNGGGLSQEETLESIAMFGDQVLPHFQGQSQTAERNVAHVNR